MLKHKVAALMNEPGCAVNQAKGEGERRQGCAGKKALAPGAAAGGCAFDGAKIALQPITDAIHLVHGPLACEGNTWDSRNSGSSGSRLYRRGFTTDLGELGIIHGGESRLFQAIRVAAERFQPSAVFVYQTCVTALIGDDVDAVCREASRRFGLPVVPVNAPGFAGSGWRARRCSTTSSAPSSPTPPVPPTSTCWANTTSPVSWGRSGRCSTA